MKLAHMCTLELTIKRQEMPPADLLFSARNLERALNTVVRWYTLGINLGIPPDRLNHIQLNNYDVNERRLALITLILDNYEIGWLDICNALQEMDHRNLAERIRREYIPIHFRRNRGRLHARVIMMVAALLIVGLVLIMSTLVLLKPNRHIGCSINIEVEDAKETLNDIFANGNRMTTQFIVKTLQIDPRICVDKWGRTLLMSAVRNNNKEVVEYLMEDWNWERVCRDNWTVLHEACFYGHLDLVRYFLTKNIDTCGEPLLNAAAKGGQMTVIEYLNKKGYSIQCSGSWSPLHAASYYGQLVVLKYLVSHFGDNVCKKCIDEQGNTPLHAAAIKGVQQTDGQLAVVDFLIRENKCDSLIQNNEGKTAEDTAHETHNQPILHYLTSSVLNHNTTVY